MRDTVRSEILAALAQARDPTIEIVAKGMAMTPRTLHRRLSSEGTSYRELRDCTRIEIAKQLLRDLALTTEQIAFRLGFSELSAFSRAFRRWTGKIAARLPQRSPSASESCTSRRSRSRTVST
jgi:AraC-like DNA-binding protein